MMTHKILNRDPKDEILKAFRLFDDDETGKISFKNLKRVAKELGERMTDEEFPRDGGRVAVYCDLRIVNMHRVPLRFTYRVPRIFVGHS